MRHNLHCGCVPVLTAQSPAERLIPGGWRSSEAGGQTVCCLPRTTSPHWCAGLTGTGRICALLCPCITLGPKMTLSEYLWKGRTGEDLEWLSDSPSRSHNEPVAEQGFLLNLPDSGARILNCSGGHCSQNWNPAVCWRGAQSIRVPSVPLL